MLKKDNLLLKIICLLAFLAATYSIFTLGQTCIHSDSAVATRLSRSIIHNKSLLPESWNAVNGELHIFHDIPFAIITSLLITNQSVATMLGSFILVALTAAGMIYFSRKTFADDSWTVAISLFLVYLSGFNATDMLLYQACYTSQMIALTFCFGLLLEARFTDEKRQQRKYYIIYFVLLILMTMGGLRYIAEHVLPILATLVLIDYYHEDIKDIKKWFFTVARDCICVLVPAAVGFGSYKLICKSHNMNDVVSGAMGFPNSLADIGSNLLTTIENIISCFGYSSGAKLVSVLGVKNLISIIIFLLVCIIVPILQTIHIKEEAVKVQAFYIFATVHNLIMLIMVVCCGKVAERYILSTICACIIMSSRYIFSHWIVRGDSQLLWKGLFVLATLAECTAMLLNTSGWQDKLEAEKGLCDTLLEHGLTKGYATYWNAYTYEVYSDNQIEFGAITLDDRYVKNYYWQVDDAAFNDSGQNSFVMLTAAEAEMYPNAIYIQLGDPIEDFVIEDAYIYDFLNDSYTTSDLFVYVYDHDVAADLADGIHDGRLDVSELWFNWLGTMTEDAFYLDNGGIVYGPYGIIDAGEYTVTYEGYGLDLAECDIYSDNNPDAIEYSFLETESGYKIAHLTVTDRVDDIQFRVFNNTDTTVAVSDILVERQ